MNIALLSPNENQYSETFIQNHKDNLSGNVIFYFGGFVAENNNKEGKLKLPFFKAALHELRGKFIENKFSRREIALMKSFEKNKINVVVAEFGITGASVINVCKALGLPLITIFHGYDASVRYVINENLKAYKELFNYVFKIIAVSNTIKEKLENIGCDVNKIIVTPCGPDNTFYDLIPKFDNLQLVACGRFVDKKAPYYTILAFNKVVEQIPDAKLKIVGDGFLFNMCENLIKHLQIENNVELVGKTTPEELKKIMINSSAFVQHSIEAKSGDSEGTPVAILEASLLGLPVISTKHSGIKDVVKDKITGFLVDEHDVDLMAHYMIKILKNKDLTKKMGKDGKQFILNNFSQNHHIGILNSVIKNSIK
jgi:colanic acid/amylovoran biosynthesis glycosyltransferase